MSSARILIVEDEGITARDLEARLTGFGHQVVAIARTGQEAIQRATQHRPDLALMDIRLRGDIDGIEAARQIGQSVGTPVVYLTAFADEQTLARVRDTAPYGYLVKPYDERELNATIQTALHRRQLDAEREQTHRVKADMIAALSHDLRSSFSTVMGLTELLTQGAVTELTPQQAKYLQSVERSLHRMLTVIHSALDFSRLERSGTIVDSQEVDVAALLGELEQEIADLGDKPEIAKHWQVAGDLPKLRTDPVKLAIVLRNLIVNAIKYTDVGTVTISAERHQDGVRFTVADTGSGIAAEMLEKIFSPFVRARGASRPTSGVGLGLYIADRFCALLGGTLEVESELGKGSVFRITLPSDPSLEG